MAKENPSANFNSKEREEFVKLVSGRWKEIGIPIRPSEEECLLYERLINEHTNGNNLSFLILGSTPELRDIALRFAARPASCDISDRIWEAMKHFMEESGEEEFIQCDWLDMPENTAYDVVLGDCSVNMLPDKSFWQLIRKIAALVKKGGVSIMRIGTSIPSLTPEVFAKAIDEYRKNSYPLSIWHFTCMLSNSISCYFYPDLTQREIYLKELSKYLTKKEIEDMIPFLVDKIYYFPKRERFCEFLNPYFEIKDVIESKGMGCWGTLHTYVIQKK